MLYTFARVANNTTNGVTIDPNAANTALSETDVEVFRVVIGAPVASGNITLYDNSNAFNGATTNIALKLTLPSSLATGQMPIAVDCTDASGHGIILKEGGNLQIDQNMQVTVMWDYSKREA